MPTLYEDSLHYKPHFKSGKCVCKCDECLLGRNECICEDCPCDGNRRTSH